MVVTIKTKDLLEIESKQSSIMKGNLACPGCFLNLSFRHALGVIGKNAVVVIPACCTSVIQGIGDGYGLNIPVFNTAFASAPSVASGISRVFKRKNPDINVIVWAGDGGTSDIGLASLSGLAERDEDVIYIMYNNEGYQNTGAQKSGSTPRGAVTTTSVTGTHRKRKQIHRIMVAHDVPYVATANAGYPLDLVNKVKRAVDEFKGHFRYIEIYSPCPPGWKLDTHHVAEVSKLAVKTGIWPLYEYINGKIVLSKKGERFKDPARRAPLEDYLKLQGRFKNMKPEEIEQLKKDIQKEWDFLLALT